MIYVVLKSSPAGTGKDLKRGFSAETYYTLTVAPEEAGSSAEYEPNNEASKATDLPRDGYREGFLSPAGDVDYYRLRTASATSDAGAACSCLSAGRLHPITAEDTRSDAMTSVAPRSHGRIVYSLPAPPERLRGGHEM